MENALTVLTAELAAEKAECEKRIAAGIRTFHEVGTALSRILEARLYADEFATFAEYCAAKWNFTDKRAYQLIGAAEVAASVSTVVEIPNERTARELARLDPSQRRKAARMLAKGHVTSQNAHAIVERLQKPTQSNQPVIDVEPRETLTRAHVASMISKWYASERPNLTSYPPASPDVVLKRIIALFN